MLSAHRSSAIVTRAVDILTAVGFRVHQMQGPQLVDRNEGEASIAETPSHPERREGDVVLPTSSHERRLALRCEAIRQTIEAVHQLPAPEDNMGKDT